MDAYHATLMRVLISAYACEPDTGSEPGVGWNWAVQAALHGHEVYVITRANNRAAIDRKLTSDPVAGLEFHYVDLSRPFLWLKEHSGYYGMLIYYYLWQLKLGIKARRLHRELSFNLVHHVTFVIDWMPAGVAWVRAPFLWGPIGGTSHVLTGKLRQFIPESGKRYEAVRRFTQRFVGRLDPLVAMTRRRARLVLAYTEEALDGLPVRTRAKTRTIVHIGVDERDLASIPEGRPDPTRFTVVSSSRLVHWKGFDLLIEGFSRFVRDSGADARLDITGDGPFRQVLEELVSSLGLNDRVTFLGRLPTRADVYSVIANAHLYALPTLRDGPPVAILEAMLAGKPILCLDMSSTHELVPDDAGLKIEMGDRPQVVAKIANALAWANENRNELEAKGARAREYALEIHDWDRIGDEIDAIYQKLAPAT